MYYYGMRLRPAGPGCQPMRGLINVDYVQNEISEPRRTYWSILAYDRPLTEQECRDYDLDLIEQKIYD